MRPPIDPELRRRAALERFPVPRGLRVGRLDGLAGRWLVLSQIASPPSLPRSLTRSESEIVILVVGGSSNQEIASARRTSPRTVANQIASIFRKLGVASRAELAARIYAGVR